MSDPVTRREFLLRSALYGGSMWLAWAAAHPRALRAAQTSKEPLALTEPQWKTVEAITARIIPSDATPGAVEAGCVNFIDKALVHEDAKMKALYDAGLAALDTLCTKRHAKPFVELAAAEQDDVLEALQDDEAGGWPDGGTVTAPDFFEAVRVHTLIGFLADPKYGGNRDYAGWKLLGYPGPRHMRGGYTPAQMRGDEEIVTIWGGKV